MLRKRQNFTSAFKKQAIRRADVVDNRKAARGIGVDETKVRRWRFERIKFFGRESNRRAFRGAKIQHPLLEDELE